MSIDQRTTEAVPPASRPEGAIELVDADVHPHLPEGLNSVLAYMPRAWQERFRMKGASIQTIVLSMRFAHPSSAALRADAAPSPDVLPGADASFMKSDLLDRWKVDRAILVSLEIGALAGGYAGPDESVMLCSAANDYFVNEWLSVDPRFQYAICVSPQDPEAAQLEIKRFEGRRGVVGVYVPLINILAGNRYYHPIFAAAQQAGLPVLLHVSGTEMIYQGGPVAAGGWPESFIERRACFSQFGEGSLASLIFSGTLERFPDLHFAFLEFGFTWVLPHLWRMDSLWRSQRIETPWVKKLPSEYVLDRVRFTTQPLDDPANTKDLTTLIDILGPELLLFSSDYPHYDGDTPNRVLQVVSPGARRLIASENAISLFGFDRSNPD